MADFFVHPTAEVSPKAKVGKGTKIWHGAQVREDVEIGENCIIGKNTYIDFGVKIGNNCKIHLYRRFCYSKSNPKQCSCIVRRSNKHKRTKLDCYWWTSSESFGKQRIWLD